MWQHSGVRNTSAMTCLRILSRVAVMRSLCPSKLGNATVSSSTRASRQTTLT
ncbi:ARF GTPase-activating protein GIT2 [Labeo rohita]|uniref:ARF GTPase-activating protein GIT2 n=1 Tax=Labeo rohita TaxID=84645 RepID=A0ABQ8LM33_LABRO|nr:ARF GTPase-activating protein GIT2 [Labeo rohita]